MQKTHHLQGGIQYSQIGCKRGKVCLLQFRDRREILKKIFFVDKTGKIVHNVYMIYIQYLHNEQYARKRQERPIK